MTQQTDKALDPEGPASSASADAGALGRLNEACWRFFCSLRLTVFTILVLASGCVIGMFFDQTLTLEQHRADWSSALWKLKTYEFLEFHDVFHSWWFGLMILVLAMNLIACSIERLPKIWIDIQNPHRHLNDEQLRGIRHVYRRKIDPKDRQRAVDLVKAVLNTRGPHTFSEEQGSTFFAFNERHRYARTGVYLVHIALLVIMFSSIATTYKGIDGMLTIVEGSNGRFVRVRGPGGLTYNHDLDFQVRCTDFRLKTFIDGAPMDFESDLEIHEFGSPINPVVKQTIQVNRPLEYKGYTFYQASYNPIPGDQLVQLDVCKRPTPGDDASLAVFRDCKTNADNIHVVSIGDRVQMPDGTAFVPVEIHREYGGLGGAVRVQKVLRDGSTTSFVVFRNYPKFDERVRRGEYIVGFRGFDQQYATGVQVGATPFINLVFAGFILMFTGMYMAFFMSQRRYWARIGPNAAGDLELVVAGAARRHQYAYEEEFSKIRDAMTEIFGAETSVAERAKQLREKRRLARAAKEAASAAADEA